MLNEIAKSFPIEDVASRVTAQPLKLDFLESHERFLPIESSVHVTVIYFRDSLEEPLLHFKTFYRFAKIKIASTKCCRKRVTDFIPEAKPWEF